LRILHVSEVHWGGVVSLIREFVDEQVARGDDVALLAPPGFPPIHAPRSMPWRFDRGDVRSYPRAFRELRRAVGDFQPDVIHLHSFMAGFLGRLPGAVRGTPVVYQPHAWSFDLNERGLFRRSVQTWERIAGRRTGVIVTNCQAEIDEGRDFGVRAPAVTIGVAIDPEHYKPVDEAAHARYREQCGVHQRRMLVCVGRLVRQKGQDLLVEAWERRPIPDTELVLVGPGDVAPLRAVAPTQWNKTIRAVGEQSEVRHWLWAADALVLSSRYETVAMVVAEAMASGRPVVATAVNGTTEVLAAGDLPAAGRIVPVGDMDSLLDEAAAILDDPEVASALAAAGRARAEQQFGPATVAARLNAAYTEAIGATSATPA
jgi:glycosyltransferase involved in cell wall biosynthesis